MSGDSLTQADDGAKNHEGVTSWWESPLLLLALVMLAGAPLWWPTTPPLVDLPGHMGHYAVQVDGGASELLARWFGVEWRWVSNLGVDLLVQMAAPLFGLELATKIAITFIPMLTIFGFLWVAKETHGRIPPTAFFALPLAWGYYFQFGFVNHSLSIALAFLSYALWLRLGRAGHFLLRDFAFVPIALSIWTAHIFGWAVLCVLVFCAEIVRFRQGGCGNWHAFARAVRQCLVLSPPLVLIVISLTSKYAIDDSPAHTWFDWDMKLFWLGSVLRDRWMVFDFVSFCVLAIVAAQGFSIWRHRGVQPGEMPLVLAAAISLLFFVVLPHGALGSAYVDMRMLPVGLAALILSINFQSRHGRRVAIAGLVFFSARIGAHVASFLQYDLAYKAELRALEHVPPGSRIVSFVGMPCRMGWSRHRLDHLPSLAIIRRESFVNNQWDGGVGTSFLMSVRYKAGYFSRDPSHFVVPQDCQGRQRMSLASALENFPRQAFDYLWVIHQPDGKYDFSGLVPLWQGGRSSLWKISPP